MRFSPASCRLVCTFAMFLAPLEAAPPNLLTNPGFESGLAPWAGYSGGTVQVVNTLPHSGAQVGRSTNRTVTNHGLRQSLLGVAAPGKAYVASAWVRTSSATPVTVALSVQQTDAWGARINGLRNLQVADTWTRISGLFRFDVNGTLTVLNLFFNGPPAGVDLFLDDVSFSAVDTSALENLLTNSDFESGAVGWQAHGPATGAAGAAHTGVGGVTVSNRTAVWHGVEQSVFGKTEDGRMYYGAGWVTTDSPTPETVRLTVEVIDSSGSRFLAIASGPASNATWTWLSGTVTLPATTGLTNVKFFVEGPPSGVALRVDDCYFAPVTGLRRAAAAFPALRLGSGGISTSHFAEDPRFRAAMSAHFHLASPGNAQKFSDTEPADGIWRFADANTIIELGLARGGSSRGHTFVWHGGLPAWVSGGTFTATQLQTMLWDQIDTKGAAFRHRLLCWDVANEAVNDGGGTLRSTLWYDTPGIGYAANGDRYLREVFARARAADPETQLFYNDYSIEDDNTKSDAVHTLLSNFVAAGVPVQGVGFQSHFEAGPNLTTARTNFQRFQDLGLDLHVTELDYRVPVDANGFATAADLTAQSDDYFGYAGAVLGYSRLRVFQTWGVYDGISWIPAFAPGFGQALLLDFELDRKPAYWGLWNALAGQCEKLAVVALSGGDTQAVVTDTRLSANAARRLNADAANDYLTLRAHVPFSGQWNVKLGVLRLTTGGRMQLAIAPPGSATFTNVAAVQDTYAAATNASVFNLGTVNFSTAGDWQFRFTVTGKNGASTAFDLALDYIRLTPIACTPLVSALPDRTIALNTALPARLFLAEDDTAQGSLVVTATSSNAALLPASAIVLEGASPYYTVAATPAADQLGSTIIGLAASDGTASYTESFTLTVTGTPLQTWRQQYFGSAANSGNGSDTANPDGDLFTNAQEYVLGTLPTGSTANPLQHARSGQNLELTFQALRADGLAYALLTRIYDLQTTTDLTNSASWQPVAGSSNILGNNQPVIVTLPTGEPHRFYRLHVRLQ